MNATKPGGRIHLVAYTIKDTAYLRCGRKLRRWAESTGAVTCSDCLRWADDKAWVAGLRGTP